MKHAWAATERVLVCVGPSPMSPRLVRSARRLAAGLRADWIAAYVETPARRSTIDSRSPARVEATLKLADELGAKTVTLTGHNVADESHLVRPEPQRHQDRDRQAPFPRWRDVLFGSVVDDLVRRSGDIDIHVIRGEAEDRSERAAPATTQPTPWDVRGLVAAMITTVIATLIGWPLYHGLHGPDPSRAPHFSNINVLMIYLVGVLWIATHQPRLAAILCSILAVAAFDFLFVPPYSPSQSRTSSMSSHSVSCF